jgi:hypothetical protein
MKVVMQGFPFAAIIAEVTAADLEAVTRVFGKGVVCSARYHDNGYAYVKDEDQRRKINIEVQVGDVRLVTQEQFDQMEAEAAFEKQAKSDANT